VRTAGGRGVKLGVHQGDFGTSNRSPCSWGRTAGQPRRALSELLEWPQQSRNAKNPNPQLAVVDRRIADAVAACPSTTALVCWLSCCWQAPLLDSLSPCASC
jgi:hypothetical protein